MVAKYMIAGLLAAVAIGSVPTAATAWGAPTVPSTIHSFGELRLVLGSGQGTARDILGITHQVSYEVAYIGVGQLETDVNAPGSITKRREAVAYGRVTFDGTVLVAGRNNHSTRPAPFIRVDIES